MHCNDVDNGSSFWNQHDLEIVCWELSIRKQLGDISDIIIKWVDDVPREDEDDVPDGEEDEDDGEGDRVGLEGGS